MLNKICFSFRSILARIGMLRDSKRLETFVLDNDFKLAKRVDFYATAATNVGVNEGIV